MEKLDKQKNKVTFKGRKGAERSNKVKLKQEEEDKEEDNEEVLDQLRYLGKLG